MGSGGGRAPVHVPRLLEVLKHPRELFGIQVDLSRELQRVHAISRPVLAPYVERSNQESFVPFP